MSTASGLPPKHMAWGHFFRDTWGQLAVWGCAKRCLCHVPSSNFQQSTFSYHCPLPGPRELGWSHLPESHHLPCCPLSSTRSSISLVENPTAGWESWERSPCLRLIQAHTTPGNLAACDGVRNPLGLSQGLEGEAGIVTAWSMPGTVSYPTRSGSRCNLAHTSTGRQRHGPCTGHHSGRAVTGTRRSLKASKGETR